MGEHAAVEFERSQKRGFDVAMGVDETRNDDLAADVDLALAAIFAHRSDDPVVADRNVACNEFAADEIENPPALQHEVGLGEPLPLLDGAAKKGDGVAHAVFLRRLGEIPRALSQAWRARSSDPSARHSGQGPRGSAIPL